MITEHSLTRQIRLAEVGAAGQARLAAASLEVRGTEGSLTELVYLCRSGVERISLRPSLPAKPFVHEALFRHSSTRRQAAGAWRAIAQMRAILSLDIGDR